VNGLGLIVALGLTCLAGYLLGAHRLGLSRTGLGAAVAAALETIGLGVLFFAGNVALVVLPLLAARAWSGSFVSVYVLDHVTIAAASLLQGLVFRWWRDRG
jgi:hypothetical protein